MIKTIALWKIYIQRSLSWISILNSGMILFLVLDKIKAYGYNINITKLYFPLVIITFILLVFAGFIEDKLQIYKEERNWADVRSPNVTQVNEKLDEILQRLKK